jgi:UDP-glucose 6-dehydrogenase
MKRLERLAQTNHSCCKQVLVTMIQHISGYSVIVTKIGMAIGTNSEHHEAIKNEQRVILVCRTL